MKEHCDICGYTICQCATITAEHEAEVEAVLTATHGGKRTGSGRKPQTHTVKTSDRELVHIYDEHNALTCLGEMATVVIISRTKREYRLDDGRRIVVGY